MNVLQLAQIIIGSIVALGILIAGAGYGIGKFLEGKNKRTLDDTNLFTAQLDALKKIISQQKDDALESTKKRDEQIRVLTEDIKKHTSEIGRLNGIIEEKDKKISELMAMIRQPDPAFGEYMKFVRDSITDFKSSVTRINNRLDDVTNKLNN